ncbi:MAG: DNA replication/repair protein RecF [Candidatus Firestonebacteria bacterium]
MYLKSLEIKNFRNLSEVKLPDLNKINVITGENAQGKTNLLESIYFLATLTSNRISTYQDLIKYGENFFYLKAEVIKNNLKKFLEVNFLYPNKLRIKTNEKLVAKKSDYSGELKVVKFSLEDVDIIKREPVNRRRSLNILISQVDKVYLNSLHKYYHILSQKNKLLQQDIHQTQSQRNLNVWNEQLVKEGVNLIKTRIDVLNFLENHMANIQEHISEGKEKINLIYKSSFEIKNDMEKNFREKIEETKREESLKKISLIGPHRDDIVFLINGKDSKYFASSGQQRSIVISLKIAEHEFLKKDSNEEAIILLDDIFFELDERRRRYALDSFNKEGEIFMALTSDKDWTKYFNNAKVIKMKEGNNV